MANARSAAAAEAGTGGSAERAGSRAAAASRSPARTQLPEASRPSPAKGRCGTAHTVPGHAGAEPAAPLVPEVLPGDEGDDEG